MTPTYPRWRVLGVVAVGTFMSALGGSLINVAIPMVRKDLSADIAASSWILAAYSLTVSSLLLAAGRLGDSLGKHRVYAAGFVVFGVGSLLSAAAPTILLLALARAFQGAGAAMLMANGPALTVAAFPPEERGRALGLQATATYLGLTVGPSVGGWLADALGWRACFLVNVPLAVVGSLVARAVLRAAPRPSESRFPWKSALAFGLALAALLIGVTRGDRWGFTSPAILSALIGGSALFAIFVALERAAPAPLLPAALLRERAIVLGLVTALLQYLATYMLLFLIPFYLEGARGLAASEAGIVMTLQPAMMALTTATSGWLSDRIGTRAPASLGLASLALGLFLASSLDKTTSLPFILLSLGLVGLGSGLFTAPNNSGVLGAAPRDKQAMTAALLAEARNVGMLSGVALASGLFAALGGGAGGGGPGFASAFHGTLATASALAATGAVVSLVNRNKPVTSS